MKRTTPPPEGWHPGYNCELPPANECRCWADCMYDGSRWRIDALNERAGIVFLYRDLSVTGRVEVTVAQDRITSVEWHNDFDCQHRLLAMMTQKLRTDNARVSQQEGDAESA